jgi:hypothetical protein
MKCPICKNESIIHVPNKFYICENCTSPKFTLNDIEDTNTLDLKPFDELDSGYRIHFDSQIINGWFKVTSLNYDLENPLKKSSTINHYHLIDANGVKSTFVEYTGVGKHYFQLFKNGKVINLRFNEYYIAE